MSPGRFISLEGVEGVGKTTNLSFIIDYLSARGVDVVQTREPGGTESGERIRSVLLDAELSMGAETELLLMYASRMQLVTEIILPALDTGRWVVTDRFADASFAYQGGGRALGFARVEPIDQWVLAGLKPDLTLFLDLPAEKGLERVHSRDEKDRIEREPIAFFNAVRKAYLQRIESDPQRFVVIDASQTLANVQRALSRALDEQLVGHKL